MALVDQINSLATRTGQEIKTVRNELATALAGKANASHTHIIGDVTGLQAALDAKLALAGGTLADAANIALGSTTGTKIGTATSQKMGFFNATPVVQQTATTDLGTALSNLGLRAAGTGYPITTSGNVNITGTLTTNKSRVSTPSNVTVATTLALTSAEYITADATTSGFNITLPSTTTPGYIFTIKKTDATANIVTVLGTIDGATNYTLTKQNDTITLMSTTTSGVWRMVSRARVLQASSITDATATGQALITAADAAAARTVIGAGTSSLALGTTGTTAKAGDYAPAWGEITSKPTTFAPSAHTHVWADLTDKPTTFAPIIGSGAAQAVAGNDPRLTDARVPLTHNQAASTISDSTTIGRGVLTAADAAAVRTLLGITSGSDPNLVNVKTAFGAVGNGTTDDSAAIINAAASITAGKVLYFPPGNYRFAQQNPTLGAAIVLAGVSNCGILFDPSARLLMDNLSGGTGTSHGILIKGSASNVAIINPTITWATAPSSRSFGDGIRVMGYPSDSAPPGGWLGSTGVVRNLSIINAQVSNAPQTGAVLHGVSDVEISGFQAIGTLGDGLHFNACRRINLTNHSAVDCGDDGLAFVCYYHASAKYADASGGPFETNVLDDWCNSGSASSVVVSGGAASGLRVQQARDLTITGLNVRDKPTGLMVNSSIAGGAIAWSSLASQNVTVNNVAIATCNNGITVKTEQISTSDNESWWRFAGVRLDNVVVRGCPNWSLTVEGNGTANSVVAGISLGTIKLIAGTGGGGNGGVNLTSLRQATLDHVRLISDHLTQLTLGGADAIRSGSITGLPTSDLTIGQLINDGGNILIQDLAGLSIGVLESRNANGDGVQLHRVRDAVIGTMKAFLPGRGAGLTRGVLLTKTRDVDIASASVTMDAISPSSFSSLEVGGGDAEDVAANGLRVEKFTYVSNRNDTASYVGSQGGAYAPVGWYARYYWKHGAAASPTWSAQLLGTVTPPQGAPAWTDITGKPTTFAPIVGTGAADAKAGNYVPAWSEITSKPTTFAPIIGATSTTAVAGNDSRLTDARTPLAHTHLWADITDKPTTFAPTIGSTATTAVAGNDARLTDARTPLAHTHTATDISNSTTIGRGILTAADAAAVRSLTGAGTSNLALGTTNTTAKAGDYVPTWSEITSKPTTFAPTIGATATTAVAGNDPRLTDARTPLAHTHLWADITDKPTTFAPTIGSTATTAVAGNDTRLTDARTPVAHQHAVTDLTGTTGIGRSLLAAADAPALRTIIGAGTSNLALGTTSTTAKAGDYVPAWTEVTGKPATFTPAAHTHAITDVTSLQTSLDAKLNKVDIPWASEMVINSAALANGYNDMPGGVLVDYDISLTHIAFRLSAPAGTIGGTGNLTVEIFLGSQTAAETTLVSTITVAAGQNNILTTLGSPVACSINSVLRAKITLGTTTVSVPCHVQFRGRYVMP